MPGTHALLSPSSASRWLACTPSARMEEQFPEKASSTAADEGTLAHSLSETLILAKLGRITADEAVAAIDAVKAHKLYAPEMYSYCDTYADYVIEQFNAAKALTSDAKLFTEQRLDMTDYVPEGYGTGDIVIIADAVMHIIDLKYGKGVPVSAEGNKQMRLYALGALKDYDFMYDIRVVKMTLYQPRLDNITSDEITVEDLRRWAEDELKPRAALAFAGEGDYAVGDHCLFCKAKAVCRAQAEYNLELAKHDFMPGPLLEDHEVADILTRADGFTKWIAAVEEHALNEAVNNGKKWPGHKLVEGRSVRQYSDEGKIVEALKGAHIVSEAYLAPQKLLGITALEKALSKPTFNELVGPYLIKPAGKPTLVPEGDKRPEYCGVSTVAAHFD